VARGDALVKSCSMNDATATSATGAAAAAMKRPSQPNLKTNGLKESLGSSGSNGNNPAPIEQQRVGSRRDVEALNIAV
jgi:hypothetical protein